MSEIDLIPLDYRKQLQLRAWSGRLAVVGAALLVTLLAARFALAIGIRMEVEELARLQAAQSMAARQQTQLEELRGRKDDLRRQLDILTGLRGGVAARQMLIAVDRALAGHLWLLDWTFRRAGEFVEKGPETAHAGYLIVVPKSQDKGPERAWLMKTHMELRGQAFDHSSLAEFVRRLVQQPEIQDVRILNTEVRRYTQTQVVHFELAVVVRSKV